MITKTIKTPEKVSLQVTTTKQLLAQGHAKKNSFNNGQTNRKIDINGTYRNTREGKGKGNKKKYFQKYLKNATAVLHSNYFENP